MDFGAICTLVRLWEPYLGLGDLCSVFPGTAQSHNPPQRARAPGDLPERLSSTVPHSATTAPSSTFPNRSPQSHSQPPFSLPCALVSPSNFTLLLSVASVPGSRRTLTERRRSPLLPAAPGVRPPGCFPSSSQLSSQAWGEPSRAPRPSLPIGCHPPRVPPPGSPPAPPPRSPCFHSPCHTRPRRPRSGRGEVGEGRGREEGGERRPRSASLAPLSHALLDCSGPAWYCGIAAPGPETLAAAGASTRENERAPPVVRVAALPALGSPSTPPAAAAPPSPPPPSSSSKWRRRRRRRRWLLRAARVRAPTSPSSAPSWNATGRCWTCPSCPSPSWSGCYRRRRRTSATEKVSDRPERPAGSGPGALYLSVDLPGLCGRLPPLQGPGSAPRIPGRGVPGCWGGGAEAPPPRATVPRGDGGGGVAGRVWAGAREGALCRADTLGSGPLRRYGPPSSDPFRWRGKGRAGSGQPCAFLLPSSHRSSPPSPGRPGPSSPGAPSAHST